MSSKNNPAPTELTGKRRKAYKKVMKSTAHGSAGLIYIHKQLSEIYKTKKSRKEALQVFDESSKIPINLENQLVKNTA